MLKVCKFGGTSLADASQWKKTAKIIQADRARTVIVVSAPGKRFFEDTKITDILYACYENRINGRPYAALLAEVWQRYAEIEKSLQISCGIEAVCRDIERKLSVQTSLPYLVSRGEYLSARLLAAYLGYRFVDSAQWLVFRPDGTVDARVSKQKFKRLAEKSSIVTPGFYGADAEGEICLFSRGGSDITGALAAKFLSADVYENWTDVNGLFAADPRCIENPEPVRRISYADFKRLSEGDLQVLHPSSILPVQQASIPLQIRNTNNPDGGYTEVYKEKTSFEYTPVLFSGKNSGFGAKLLVCVAENKKYTDKIIKAFEAKNIGLLFTIRKACTLYAIISEKEYNAALLCAYQSIYKEGSLD